MEIRGRVFVHTLNACCVPCIQYMGVLSHPDRGGQQRAAEHRRDRAHCLSTLSTRGAERKSRCRALAWTRTDTKSARLTNQSRSTRIWVFLLGQWMWRHRATGPGLTSKGTTDLLPGLQLRGGNAHSSPAVSSGKSPQGLSGQWVVRSWNNEELLPLLYVKPKPCLSLIPDDGTRPG